MTMSLIAHITFPPHIKNAVRKITIDQCQVISSSRRPSWREGNEILETTDRHGVFGQLNG